MSVPSKASAPEIAADSSEEIRATRKCRSLGKIITRTTHSLRYAAAARPAAAVCFATTKGAAITSSGYLFAIA